MLRLPDSVTTTDAGATERLLSEAIRTTGEPVVVVDATALQRFDSAALAVLLACERLAAAAGKRFSVLGLPPQLGSLATLYGIDGLLPAAAGPAAAATPTLAAGAA